MIESLSYLYRVVALLSGQPFYNLSDGGIEFKLHNLADIILIENEI